MFAKKFKRTFTYGQICAWIIMCLLPVIGVCLSTKNAFPKTNQFADLTLLVELGASLIFLFYSSTPREINPWIARYSLSGEFLLAAALWANFVIHLGFTRDIDRAEQSIVLHNEQKERESKFREEENNRDIKRSQERQKELERETSQIKAQNNQLWMLPRSERRSPPKTSNESSKVSSGSTIAVFNEKPVQVLDPEKVRQDWYKYLWIALLGSAGFSIMGISGLTLLWKWDPPSLPQGSSQPEVSPGLSLNRPQLVPESSLENVLIAPRIVTSCVPESSLNGKTLDAVWDGREWKVMGHSLPNLSNIRYVAKPGKGTIEVLPSGIGTNDGTNYLTNLSKSFLDKISKLPKDEALEEVKKRVNAAKEAKGIPVS